MNKQDYFGLVERELNNIKDVIQRKNNDYTAGNQSAFANFEDTGGMCHPLVGLLLRMGDKMQRLRTFAKNGTLQVKGEGAEDAFRDLIGYSLIGLGMLAEDSAARTRSLSSPSAPEPGMRLGKRYKSETGEVWWVAKEDKSFPTQPCFMLVNEANSYDYRWFYPIPATSDHPVSNTGTPVLVEELP